MFTKPRPKTPLEKEIDIALVALSDHKPSSEEYAKIVDQIAKLHEMKEIEKPSRVSYDTWALIGANLAGILLIIRHENTNVITSKAMSLLVKPR
jgi:hypothetical protein